MALFLCPYLSIFSGCTFRYICKGQRLQTRSSSSSLTVSQVTKRTLRMPSSCGEDEAEVTVNTRTSKASNSHRRNSLGDSFLRSVEVTSYSVYYTELLFKFFNSFLSPILLIFLSWKKSSQFQFGHWVVVADSASPFSVALEDSLSEHTSSTAYAQVKTSNTSRNW